MNFNNEVISKSSYVCMYTYNRTQNNNITILKCSDTIKKISIS